VGLAATGFPALGLSFTKFRQEANLDSKACKMKGHIVVVNIIDQVITNMSIGNKSFTGIKSHLLDIANLLFLPHV
jgi:hypothetical protein